MKPIIYLTIFLALAVVAIAMPPLPQEVYGTLTINGDSASSGQNISVYDSDGILCGSHITRHKGLYGLLSCRGDDPDSEQDEGATNGEQIIIAVNGQEYEKMMWQSGRFTNMNISIEQHAKRFNIGIKMPRLGEKEFSLFIFLLIALLLLLLSTIFLKKAIEK